MVTTFDVANFFIDMLKDGNQPVTVARLNKMLYFAQGHCLERLGRPLFGSDIEAWRYGPVIPEIYHSYKTDVKYARIKETKGEYDKTVFSSDELELLFDVITAYNGKTTNWMIRETHREGGPWAKKYVPKMNEVIDLESMTEYFSKEPLPRFFNSKMSKLKTVGYHNAEGHLVLPADWDD